MDQIVLASSSQQRLEICRRLGLDPVVVVPEVDETPEEGESGRELALRLAKAKATAVASSHPESIVIAGDSVVELSSTLLGKPANVEQAQVMLEQLSGQTHHVYSGLAITKGAKEYLTVGETAVTFREILAEELAAYLSTGEWEGRAGGCCIQSRGEVFVERIDGSFSNVVGLPIAELGEGLAQMGISLQDVWGANV